jgi:hypothetical protein
MCALLKSTTKVHEGEYKNFKRRLLHAVLRRMWKTKICNQQGVSIWPRVMHCQMWSRLEQRADPFQLLKWIPCSVPFALEYKFHQHFEFLRLKETGASTEFFEIDVNDIGTMIEALLLSSANV